MNPKSEFIKAIMSVLRLEANIYTTASIETIIERLEIEDYQLFIAYLGERKSDYEKPIENIAKGVDEFYEKKIQPLKLSASDKSKEVVNFLQWSVSYIAEKQDETQQEIIQKLIKKPEQIKEFKANRDGVSIQISDSDYIAISNVGFKKFLNGLFEYNASIWLRDEMLKPYIKKSISDRIEDEGIKESTQMFQLESSKVKGLIASAIMKRDNQWY